MAGATTKNRNKQSIHCSKNPPNPFNDFFFFFPFNDLLPNNRRDRSLGSWVISPPNHRHKSCGEESNLEHCSSRGPDYSERRKKGDLFSFRDLTMIVTQGSFQTIQNIHNKTQTRIFRKYSIISETQTRPNQGQTKPCQKTLTALRLPRGCESSSSSSSSSSDLGLEEEEDLSPRVPGGLKGLERRSRRTKSDEFLNVWASEPILFLICKYKEVKSAPSQPAASDCVEGFLIDPFLPSLQHYKMRALNHRLLQRECLYTQRSLFQKILFFPTFYLHFSGSLEFRKYFNDARRAIGLSEVQIPPKHCPAKTERNHS